MTNRIHVRELDPTGGANGEGIVISGGEFTIGPVTASGDFVVNDGVPSLSYGPATPAGPHVVGRAWYDPDDNPPPAAAADVTVADAAFTHIVGTDVQAALDSIDDQLGVGGTPASALVPLTTVVGGVPELVWDENNNLVMTEVPL